MQTNNTEHKKLLSIGEAAEYLGVSVDTLRRWGKKGRVEAYRSPGGHRHYDIKDLDNLFNKKYTRDEPTIRSSGEKKETDKPQQVEEAVNTPQEQKEPEVEKELPKITLPAWRAINYQPEEETVIEESIEEEILIEEKVLERPIREVKIPESARIRVTQRETVMSPNEAYIRQQSVSVLTPPSNDLKSNTPLPILDNKNQEKPKNKNIQDNKALLIYLSVMASIVLFGIAWYFLWKNSQTVLSPVP